MIQIVSLVHIFMKHYFDFIDKLANINIGKIKKLHYF